MPLVTSPSDIRGYSQANQPATVPEGGLWYDTSVDTLYVSDGSTFNTIGASSFAGAAVVSQSVTIGNYTTPTSATASSNQITLSDDFTSSGATSHTSSPSTVGGWLANDYTKMLVNGTTDVINFTAVGDSSNDSISYDLTSVSDTAWVLRFKLTYTTITTGSGMHFTIGLSSADSATSQSSSQDSISAQLDSGDSLLVIDGGDGAVMGTGGGGDGSAAYTFVINTPYYVELIRASATSATLTVYSNSGYTTVLASTSCSLVSTIQTLRYIKFCNRVVSAGGTQIGTIDDLLFMNGAATITNLNTNLFDDNTATRWTSNSEVNPNCYVDQGSSLNFAGAAFFYDNTNTTATSMLIQTSSDGVTFTTKRTITTSNLVSGYNFYRFNIATGVRYVRFYGNDAGAKVLSLYEVKIYQRTNDQIINDLGILEITSTDATLNAAGT